LVGIFAMMRARTHMRQRTGTEAKSSGFLTGAAAGLEG
jgi:hypothetical protein